MLVCSVSDLLSRSSGSLDDTGNSNKPMNDDNKDDTSNKTLKQNRDKRNERDSNGREPKNALENLNEIKQILLGRKLAVFLDYDGTLTPIVNVPSEAKISQETRSLVATLSKQYPTAIITGRSIETITQFVKLDSIYYAGSHGFDIRSPGGQEIIRQVGAEFLPLLAKARDSLREKVKNIPGSLVEDNVYSVSVHYRRVDKEFWKTMEKAVNVEIERFNGKLKMGHGKMVYELRANIEWHKGRAVRQLLKELGPVVSQSTRNSIAKGMAAAEGDSKSTKASQNEPSQSSEAAVDEEQEGAIASASDSKRPRGRCNSRKGSSVPPKKAGEKRPSCELSHPVDELPAAMSQTSNGKKMKPELFALYIGDDTTDEDAFRELTESKRGFGIRVLSKGGNLSQPTSAKFVLSSVDEVQQFLNRLSKMSDLA